MPKDQRKLSVEIKGKVRKFTIKIREEQKAFIASINYRNSLIQGIGQNEQEAVYNLIEQIKNL